jgi:DNA (cytosine-5)-methyltransferase 1
VKLQDYACGETAVETGGRNATNVEVGNLLKTISMQVAAGRRRAVANMFDITERYEAAKPFLSSSQLKTYLADICGMPASQVAGYAALLHRLSEHKEVLVEHGVAPEVVLKLAAARADVREEGLRMVKSGRALQSRELAAIKRDIDHGKLRVDGVLDPRRRAILPRFAAKKARLHAERLVADVETFARRLLPWLEVAGFNAFIEPHKDRLSRDAAVARNLLDRLSALGETDDLFGGASGWVWERARDALRAIIDGRVSEHLHWDPVDELATFAPEDCSEIAYNPSLIADLARAAGFVIDPGHARERSAFQESDRHVLTDDPQKAVGRELTVLELCAGGGGQAIGLHAAGFKHVGLVEWNAAACATISINRPDWPVINADLRDVDYEPFRGVDLLAGGVPCTPFSAQGLRQGRDDKRDMFMEALKVVKEVRPKAIMLENVLGLFHARHLSYRVEILARLARMGYDAEWREIQGAAFGMAQRRRRTLLVGMQRNSMHRFRWPEPLAVAPKTVAETLKDLMAANGWKHADDWAQKAGSHCHTIVGGSDEKTGGDLARENGRRHWLELAVNPNGVAFEAPGADAGPAGEPGNPADVDTFPKLTLRMIARLQEFPDEWRFSPPRRWKIEHGFDSSGDIARGSPMATFRQIANAFPPSLARAMGIRIRRALTGYGPDIGHELLQPYKVKRPRFDMRDAYRNKQSVGAAWQS